MLTWIRRLLGYTFVCLFPATAIGAGEPLTVERIFGDPPLLTPAPGQLTWLGDSRGVSFLERREGPAGDYTAFVIREVPSGNEHVVCMTDTIQVPEDLGAGPFKIGVHAWDNDGKRIVFTFAGDIFTLDAGKARVTRITQTAGAEKAPTFSPDGERLAYTRDNDLYVFDFDTKAEIPITVTGCDTVYNGILDYLYMEELFTRGKTRAFWWSPDSRRIAFLQIREGRVPVFPLVDWLPRDGAHQLQRFTKPGDPLPFARVGTVSARGGDVSWADVDSGDDGYIARVYWLGDSRGIAIEKLNRDQDDLRLIFCDARSGRCEEVVAETADDWVNVTYLRHYYKRKRKFLWGSERDGHSHLYLYNIDGSPIRRLTQGDWEVITLAGVDEDKGKVYFVANENNVGDRQLYVVSEKGKDLTRVSKEPGEHKIEMSPDRRYYIDTYSTATRPPVVSVHSASGESLFVIVDRMSPAIAELDAPTVDFHTLEANGHTFQTMMIKPPGFDPAQTYPVLVFTYGGPHSQIVRDAWARHLLWHMMMAQKGYIIFSLDNRGSAGRGKDWEAHIIRNMGKVELEDQLAGVAYLKSLPYVDPNRVGIWGWSYGGYMTLNALFKARDVFTVGAAVAPVTDWRLYDAIYTERYMKQPRDNPEGYTESAPLNFVDGFAGKLLLMHGLADDNVHAQNTVQLVQKLIEAGIDFELMLYPKYEHGIKGNVAQRHLYGKLERFFDRHLMGANK